MNEGVYGPQLRELGVSLYCLNIAPRGIPLQGLWQLVRLLKLNKPDLVQTWMYHADLLGGLAARFNSIPVVWGVRRSELGRRQMGNATWLIAKFCAVLSRVIPRAIINCSRRSIAVHRRFGYADKFIYVPNGFAHGQAMIPESERVTKRKSWQVEQDTVVFGHVARLHSVKGQSVFIASFASVSLSERRVVAVMAGEGISRDHAEFVSLVEGTPEQKLLALGPIARVPELMRSFDVFVLSSRSEGFPNVVAEAMLQGTPCIVTDVGDAAEIVGDTGWVVAPNDVDALASAMLQAANITPEQRQQRGAAARERIINNYGIDKMVTGFEEVWQQAILWNGRK